MKKRLLVFLFILCLAPTAADCASWQELSPTKAFYINDFAGVLSDDTESEIAKLGAAVEQATGGAQAVVVTVDSLGGETIRSFGFRLGDKWGIGKKGEDNGVILILALRERQYSIEVGDGLGGALPDSLTGRIQDEIMAPYLKQGDYSSAMREGYRAVAGEICKEYGVTVEGAQALEERQVTPVQAGLAFFLLLFLLSLFRRGPGGFLFFPTVPYSRGGGSFGQFPRGGGGSFGGGGSSRGF